MVSQDVQIAVSQRYATLANAITHGQTGVEQSLLEKGFTDRAKLKLSSYEYDPLTILVQRIDDRGNTMRVKAYYVGVNGRSEVTMDRWLLVNGSWRLTERDPASR